METNNEDQTIAETKSETLTDTKSYTETKVQIAIIMRQTTYTKKEAETLFDELGSVEKCIEHYLGIQPKGEPNISTNQKIFKSIRDFF
jgi:hypothetical protein